jgi:hypothetical protein
MKALLSAFVMAGLLSGCELGATGQPNAVEQAVQVAAQQLIVSLDDLPPLDPDLVTLHPKQQIVFDSPATEILYGGAGGGGKSHLIRVALIKWSAEIPGLQTCLIRRLSVDLLKNHMDGPTGFRTLLAPWVASGDVRITTSPACVHWVKTGAKIYLDHCQHERDKYGFQGREIHVAAFDELTHFTESIYRFIRRSLRKPDALRVPERYKGRFPKILNGTNPGNVGHNWVKRTFIDSAPPFEVHRRPKDDGGLLRQFVPALLEDNPSIDPEDYEGSLLGIGNPALAKAMRYGDWDIVAGGMFDDLWKRDIHVVKPFPIPAGWYVDRSFDWGSSKPFSVLWWAEANGEDVTTPDGRTIVVPRGTVFAIAEWYGCEKDQENVGLKMSARKVAEGILDREARMVEPGLIQRAPHPGPADSAIYTKDDEEESIADKMEAAGVEWVPCAKGPGSRVNGWEVVRNRLEASTESPMEDPGLFIFDTCRDLIRCLPVAPRDQRNSEDLDTDSEDHNLDATRYRLTAQRHEVDTAEGWW